MAASLLLLMAAPSIAQVLDKGVKLGVAMTNLSNIVALTSPLIESGAEPTISFGGFVTFPISGGLAFQTEALFSSKGQRIRDKDAQATTIVGPIGTTITKLPEADRVVLLNYLEIPLLMRLSTTPATPAGTSFHVLGGLALAFKMGAKLRWVTENREPDDIGSRISGSDVSLVMGGGLQRGHVIAEGRLTQGLKNVAIDPSLGSVKTKAVTVILGVRF